MTLLSDVSGRLRAGRPGRTTNHSDAATAKVDFESPVHLTLNARPSEESGVPRHKPHRHGERHTEETLVGTRVSLGPPWEVGALTTGATGLPSGACPLRQHGATGTIKSRADHHKVVYRLQAEHVAWTSLVWC